MLRLISAFLKLILSVLSLSVSTHANAEIVTDGTVGPARTLNGPNFLIPENLGSLEGSNLFHSFQLFNLNQGEQATFTGSNSITHVFSRVTGGQPSSIDGSIISTIGQADFYFINPAGVFFGANAQINVPGSFYVSTADELRFVDGSIYSATNPQSSTLTIEQPESFGFLGDQTASINIDQSQLEITSGKTLALSGGDIAIDQARITLQQGDVQLVTVGQNAANVTLNGEVSTESAGLLDVDQSRISVSGDGAGRVLIRTGTGSISRSDVLADNIGPTQPSEGQGIDFGAQDLQIEASLITADLFEQGAQSADVNINVSGDMTITEGSLISNTTFTEGNAGDIQLKAENLTIDELGSDQLTGIVADVERGAQGDAGSVVVEVENQIALLDGGIIRSNTFDDGNAGSILVKAGRIFMDGNKKFFGSGISSDSFRSIGDAGSVEVQVANDITMTENGFISSFTGQGGGNAGDVEVTAGGNLSLSNHARIFTDSFDSGDAGNVRVTAQDISIDDQNNRFVTGITSASRFANGEMSNSSGQAGNISVNAQNISIDNGGTIAITVTPSVDPDALSKLKPTSIDIKSNTVGLSNASITTRSSGNIPAGSINLNVNGTLTMNPAVLSTQANDADGGAIAVQANIIDLQDSQITTSVEGQGNGGDIELKSNNLVLESGFIQANTAGANASGGDIRVDAGALVASNNILLTGGNEPIAVQRGINVIQAAAPDGVSGNIDISSPQLDISGDLANLDPEIPDVEDLIQNPCKSPGGKQSTLVSVGYGGLPVTPEQAGTVTITPERLERMLSDDVTPPKGADTASPKSEKDLQPKPNKPHPDSVSGCK